MLKNFSFIMASYLLLSLPAHSEIITRGSFDIGSGETKLTVAKVNTDNNQIVEILYQNSKDVALRNDLANSPDGNLSKNAQEKLISTIQDFKAETNYLNPTQWYGIGTSVFLTAKNGQDILKLIKAKENVTIDLLTHEEEGVYGLLTAMAASKIDIDEVISWDSGSGSFQIATKIGNEVNVYGAEFAFVPAMETLFANRSQPISKLSPNPVTRFEVTKLIESISKKLPPVPAWLEDTNKKIIALGGNNIFTIGTTALKQPSFSKDQVWEAIEKVVNLSDEQLSDFQNPANVVVSLALLYAVMDHCNMENITYYPTNGSCEGILILPQNWNGY